MPNPNEYQSEDEFLKVCIPTMISEGKDNPQAVAICKSMWSKKADKLQEPEMPQKENPAQPQQPEQPKQPKGKIDILADIKKAIEKNGYTIDEDKLLAMVNQITKVETIAKKFSLEYRNDEIKVFPRKKVYVEKYNGYFDFNSQFFQDIIFNFENEKLFKPFVDLEHKLGEKYADIVHLEEKEDGLYAKLNLNDSGRELIINNKYSYISPEWGSRVDTDKQLHKNVLIAITLTNIPALEGELPKLQEQIKLQKGENMENLKLRLSKLEGKVSKYKLADGTPSEAPMVAPEIMEAIQMIKDALAKIDELTQATEQAQEVAAEMQKKLNAIEIETNAKEKDAFFTTALEKGQIEMKELELLKSQYDTSKDFVKKLVSMRLEKSNTQKTITSISNNNVELSNEDYKIMDQYNYKLSDGSYDINRYKKEILNDVKINQKYGEAK